MQNIARVKQVIAWMEKWGCAEAVVCAGARNAPLVVALHQIPGLKVWSFFEERSAAFFAIGRMKTLKRPVAVITTSGTAAAELLPATIEAHYTGLPLLLITADRPPQFRGTGAPQSIEQVGIFSHYVENSLDYAGDAEKVACEWSLNRPLHLNVCFSEPTNKELAVLSQPPLKNFNFVTTRHEVSTSTSAADAAEVCKAFASQSQQPVVILGPIDALAAPAVEAWLKEARLSVYMEGLSNLTHTLKGQQVRGGERSLHAAIKHGWVDGIIRIGGVPTTRLWRDLEIEWRGIPVLSFSDQPFSGLSRDDVKVLPLSALNDWRWDRATAFNPLWFQLQLIADQNLKKLMNEFPLSEPAMLYKLTAQIPDGARVYLGNSLPVREWDLLAVCLMKPLIMAGSRGANGIDGQLSTFLGFAEPDKSNWCVVGDLTALYDLSAPWILPQGKWADLNFVVINNGGGKIFSRMYGRNELENHHKLQFQNWAKMWNLNYQRCVKNESFTSGGRAAGRVIEIVPDDEHTKKFWGGWDLFWKDL